MDAMSEFRQRMQYLRALEKKTRRLLLRGENEKAVKILKYIIDGYREIGVAEKAKILEDSLRNLLEELNLQLEDIEDISDDKEEVTKRILGYIEALEKKVKRRILQGKSKEAIEELQFIIVELREHNLHEKADMIEMNLNQYVTDLSTNFEIKVTSPPPPAQTTPVPDFAPSPPPPAQTAPVPNFAPSPPPPLNIEPPSVDFYSTLDVPAPHTAPHSPSPDFSPAYPAPAEPSKTLPPDLPASSPPTTPNPVTTIKDQPLSDEEVLLKKLLDIKVMLRKEEVK